MYFSKMPKRARQDNKDFVNRGTGGSNRNSIRYPKKKRKTAWKRFYKLSKDGLIALSEIRQIDKSMWEDLPEIRIIDSE